MKFKGSRAAADDCVYFSPSHDFSNKTLALAGGGGGNFCSNFLIYKSQTFFKLNFK